MLAQMFSTALGWFGLFFLFFLFHGELLDTQETIRGQSLGRDLRN